ncbi:MAG: hypothetical protein IPK56_11305 [Elusimicrobia bacterium]|nr:hypothetical protein [Elusimicrobiota bacterium]
MLLQNLTVSLFRHEEIRTTVAKAKVVAFRRRRRRRPKNATESRRRVTADVNDEDVRKNL